MGGGRGRCQNPELGRTACHPIADHVEPDDLTYLLLGRGGALFLAHVISQPPDFDQILSVELAGPHGMTRRL